jgi:fatty-acyl-CoA synthase
MAPAKLKPQTLLPCYGMAEATLAISFIGLDEQLTTDLIDQHAYQTDRTAVPLKADTAQKGQEFVSCGRTFPKHEVAAFSDDGARLGDRHIGELRVRGPSVSKGYYNDPETTERVFGGGWLKTGDLGYLVEGNVYITGRKKDLIIINGRNYDPQRIEWLVDELPDVRKGSTVAFSRPGASSEELVIVVESRSQTPDALKETIRTRISEQLQLTTTDIVLCPLGSLPKTSSGKLQRAKTRQQYLEGTVGQEGNRSLGGRGEKFVVARHVALSLLGRSQHRARRVLKHTVEIRSMGDALSKLKLASDYLTNRVGRIIG